MMKARSRALLCCLVAVTLAGCSGERGSSFAEGPRAAAAQETQPPSAAAAAQIRRLWSGGEFNFYASSPSPDGRYVTEIDWRTGNLAVRDLSTGELYRLTDKGSWQESGDYALSSTFSPNGEEVAYVWWSSPGQRHELRVMSVDFDSLGVPRGSNVRVVHDAAGLQAYQVHGWSAEDEILVVLRRPDRSTALALVSSVEGAVTVLESFDWRAPHAMYSPHGRFVAYDVPRDVTAVERVIRLTSGKGDRRVDLVTDAGDAVVLGWESPDTLVYAKRDSGSTTLWRLPVRDGSSTGPPELLSGDVLGRVEPLGTTTDAFYFGVAVESQTFRIANVDLEGRRLLGEPAPVDNPYDGRIDALDWSPDGHHYAAAVRTDPDGSAFVIVIGSLDGSRLNAFQGPGRVDRLRWVPGRDLVAFYGIDESSRPTIRTLDLKSGEMRTVRRFDRMWGAMGGHMALTPDGRDVYFRLLAPGAEVSRPTEGAILALDLETGVERRVQSVSWGGSLAVSPDGDRLAYVDHGPGGRGSLVLRVIPTGGGGSPAEVRGQTGGVLEGLNWTPDGGSLVFLGGAPGSGEYDVWIIPSAGGVAEPFAGAPPVESGQLRLHPDGTRIAFVSGENRGEIWALSRVGPR